MLAFYGCYFLKMLSQHRNGIQTSQIGRKKQGLARFIESAMSFAATAVPILELASLIRNTPSLPLWARIAGLCAGLAGTAVFLLSTAAMGDSWRAGVPQAGETRLITNGIYQFSRNPAFLGFELVYLGMFLLFSGWILLALSALTALLFHLQIVTVEEPFLTCAFGGSYIAYRNQVHRYWGRTRRNI